MRINRDHVVLAVLWGMLSIALYVTLFVYERDILVLSVQPWWSVILPITVAFVFSIVHGNFTSYFWDALNVKPKGHATTDKKNS